MWLAACSAAPRRAAALGEAYAGPAELQLRADIPLESRPVAAVRRGERLEILEQRRGAFFRVRTAQGAVGWTDFRQLLSAEEMAALRNLTERAGGMPSQGAATAYGDLRVHTAPSRTAPSFILLKENDKVDVLGYLAAPRAGTPRPPLLPPKKAKTAAVKTAPPSKPPKYPLPPPPPPPGPPPNWLDLSQPTLAQVRAADDSAETPEDHETNAPPDTWALVRTARGECGWALARALSMAIPDEVAQYAEGRRIVAYFSLGQTRDGDELKNDWLWTTAAGGEPYDFDSFRVFVWSLRRHRYETARIERDLKGYLPVRLSEVELPAGPRRERTEGRYPAFAVCVEKAGGQRRWREYAFLDPAVRFLREEPCEPAPPLLSPAPAPPAAPPPPAQRETLAQRGRRWLRSLVPRWFSR
jgi:hypothetical protein